MDAINATPATNEGSVIDADQIWKFAWTYIKTVVDTLREPFLILDKDLKVLSANRSFYEFFQVSPDSTINKRVYDLGNGQWNIPKLKTLLEEILPQNTFFKDFEVNHEFPVIGRKDITLNARRIYLVGELHPMMMLAMEDMTKQKKLENQLKEYTEKLSQQISDKTQELEKRVLELERLNRDLINEKTKDSPR